MNSDKPALSRQRGNVMIYILIALGLLGGLTVAMTRQGDQDSGENLDAEQADLYATQIIAYAGAAQQVIDQMINSGSTVNQLDFVNPTSSGFNIGTTAVKAQRVFHPNGGGLNYKVADLSMFDDYAASPPEGYYIGRFNTLEWSPTSAQ